MFLSSNITIEVLSLPNGTSVIGKGSKLIGCVRFQGMHGLRQGLTGSKFREEMHVVRHYYPSGEIVSLAIEKENCVLDELRSLWNSKDARAGT